MYKSVPCTETGIKDGFEEMERVHEFRFGPLCPEKQDYLFRCPVAPAEIFCWNDLKSRVPLTSQPDFPEFSGMANMLGTHETVQYFGSVHTRLKSASTIRPGRGGTSDLTDFDETWPV